MKVVAKPIQMIAWFTKGGDIKPIRFKIDDEGDKVISVGKIINKGVEKLAGTKMYIFTCLSEINGIEKIYEIKYDIEKCKWVLFKI